MKIKRALSVAAAVVFTLMAAVLPIACDDCGDKPTPGFRFSENQFLRVVGEQIKDGNDETVVLRGVNAGGYLVLEGWMSPFVSETSLGAVDHKRVTEIFTQRFGKKATVDLWEHYRKEYWKDVDFYNCSAMGFNVIRLPFTYMSVDPAYNNVPEKKGQKYNFDVLDDFVRCAESYGLYTILDMHGAYGSQNGKDHSGQRVPEGQVTFYENGENRAKTRELWAAIAEHFKGDPAVAGYDLLNEPADTLTGNVQITTKKHWDYFDELYKAIRAKDSDHMVIFESCWEPSNLPKPSDYGWTNCVYSIHHYSNKGNSSEHIPTIEAKKRGVDSAKHGVPIYMGEFTCYNDETSWDKTLALFDDYGWSWTSWTYKMNDARSYGAWAIYKARIGIVGEGETRRDERINPDTDDIEDIKAKMSRMATDGDDVKLTEFSTGKTLYDLLYDCIGRALMAS